MKVKCEYCGVTQPERPLCAYCNAPLAKKENKNKQWWPEPKAPIPPYIPTLDSDSIYRTSEHMWVDKSLYLIRPSDTEGPVKSVLVWRQHNGERFWSGSTWSGLDAPSEVRDRAHEILSTLQ